MLTWFDMGWLGWLGLGGLGAAGLAAWALGLPTLFKAVGSVIEIITPILKACAEGVVWVWQKVIWPGVVDILDTWATLLTVGGLMVGLFLFMSANSDIRHNDQVRALQACQGELVKAKRKSPAPAQSPLWELKWPWG